MKRDCSLTGEEFVVTEAEQDYCQENGIPLPTLHPHERLRHMLYFRNRLDLYKTKCGFSGEQMLSCVPPESKYTVYDIGVWESDDWDPEEYAMDYDFNKPFFAQFAELLSKVPIPNLMLNTSLMENSDYTNGITGAKNCYLLFSASFSEDCLFSGYLRNGKNIVDCVQTNYSELCYDCINVNKGYSLKFSEECFNCSNSNFLFGCQSCSDCYGCVNLRNKK